MYLTKKHLSRRTVLRAAGVSLGLPLLDAMIPAATALAQTAAAPRLRVGFFYLPHGAIMSNTAYGAEMDRWTPSGAGGVPDMIWMNRGTYNQLVHLGPGPKLYGENVVSPGQSGDPSSPHFADQWLMYSTWSYKPMRLNEKDLKGFVESTVVLDLDD